MGPWTHGISSDGKVGDLDFGRTAVLDLRDLHAQWFDHCLKGERNAMDRFPALRIFVMGRNVWRDERAWPLERIRWTRYYLHSEGVANTLSGNGGLSTDAAGDEPPDRFTYDPNDPVPTLGGSNLFGCPAGPRDQAPAERRGDVLVYTSGALPADLEVTGPVRAVLFAASSAVDTDWTVKLLDVHADGRAFNLCDGIVRSSYRDSPDRPLLAKPHEVYRYEIDLSVTSNVFLAGHKIRVELSSSNFPRFDRNVNTAEPFGAGTRWIPATQGAIDTSDKLCP